MDRIGAIEYLTNKTRLEKSYFEALEDDKLEKCYVLQLKEDDILKNGIQTCRISYNNKEIEKRIDKYIEDNNIIIFRDGKIKTEYYHGNYCIVGFPLNEAKKIQDDFKISIDLIRQTLSLKDIQNYKKGDKVTITSDNTMFGNIAKNKGTVYQIWDDRITIKKYKSKTKGWVLKIGDNATILKGW